MDRAYNDSVLFAPWTSQGVFFVPWMKENAVYKVIRQNPLPQNSNIIADEIIKLIGTRAEHKCPCRLRRLVLRDEINQRQIVLLTNHLQFAASTIAAIYKDRWEIELFFKALKQTLKVKTFIETTENALRIQIWTALIAMLILKWLHHISKVNWSFSNMADLIRLNLFTCRELREWLTDPYHTRPIIPMPEQLSLPLPGLGQARPVAKG